MNIFNVNFKEIFNNNSTIDHEYVVADNIIKLSLNISKFDVYVPFSLDLQQDLDHNTVIDINGKQTSIYDYDTQLISKEISSGLHTFLYDTIYNKLYIIKKHNAQTEEKVDFNLLIDRQEAINHANNILTDEINHRKILYHDTKITPHIEVLNGGKIVYDGIKNVITHNDKLYILTTEFVIITDANHNELKRIKIDDVVQEQITKSGLNADQFKYYNFDKIFVDDEDNIYVYYSQYQQFKEGNEPATILMDDTSYTDMVDDEKPIVFNKTNAERVSCLADNYIGDQAITLKDMIDLTKATIQDDSILSQVNAHTLGLSIRFIDSASGRVYWGNSTLKTPIVCKSSNLTKNFNIIDFTDKILTDLPQEFDIATISKYLENTSYNVNRIDIEIALVSVDNSINYIPLMDTLGVGYKTINASIKTTAQDAMFIDDTLDADILSLHKSLPYVERLFRSTNDLDVVAKGEEVQIALPSLVGEITKIITDDVDLIHLSYIRNSTTDFKGSILNVYVQQLGTDDYKIFVPNDPFNNINNIDTWNKIPVDEYHEVQSFDEIGFPADYINVSLYNKNLNKYLHTFTMYDTNKKATDDIRLYSDHMVKALDKNKAQRLLILKIGETNQYIKSDELDHMANLDNEAGFCINKLSEKDNILDYPECDQYMSYRQTLIGGNINKYITNGIRQNGLYHPIFMGMTSFDSKPYLMVIYAAAGYYTSGYEDAFIIHIYEHGDLTKQPIIYDNPLNILGYNMIAGKSSRYDEADTFKKYGRVDSFSSILDINEYEEIDNFLYMPTRLGEVLVLDKSDYALSWLRTSRHIIPDAGQNKNLHSANLDIKTLSNQSLGKDTDECVIDVHSHTEISTLAPHNVYNYPTTNPVGYIIKNENGHNYMYMTYNDDLYMGTESIVFNLDTKKEEDGFGFKMSDYRYIDTLSLMTSFESRDLNLTLSDYKSNQLKILNRNKINDFKKISENHKISLPLGINDKFEKGSTLIRDVYSYPLKFLKLDNKLLLIVRNSSNIFEMNIDDAIEEYKNNSFTKQLFDSELTDKVITHLQNGSQITLSENDNHVYNDRSHAMINDILESRFNAKSLFINDEYIDIVDDGCMISDVVIGFDDIIPDKLAFNFYVFLSHEDALEVRIYQLVLSKTMVDDLYDVEKLEFGLKANKILKYRDMFKNLNLFNGLISLYNNVINVKNTYTNNATSRMLLPQMNSNIFYSMFNNYDNIIISSTDVASYRRRYDYDKLLDGSFNLNINGIMTIPIGCKVNSLFNTNNKELFSIDITFGSGIHDSDIKSTPSVIDSSNNLLNSDYIVNKVLMDKINTDIQDLIFYPLAYNIINDFNVFYMMNTDRFIVIRVDDTIRVYSVAFTTTEEFDYLYMYNQFKTKIFDIIDKEDGDLFDLTSILTDLTVNIQELALTNYTPAPLQVNDESFVDEVPSEHTVTKVHGYNISAFTKVTYHNMSYNNGNSKNDISDNLMASNIFFAKDYNPVKYDSSKSLMNYPLIASPIKYDNINIDHFDDLYPDTNKSSITNIKYDLISTPSNSNVFKRKFRDYKSSNNTHVFANTWHINRLDKIEFSPLDKSTIDAWNTKHPDYKISDQEDIQYGLSAYKLDVDKYKSYFLQSHTSLAYLMGAPVRQFGSYYFNNNAEDFDSLDDPNKKTMLFPTNTNYDVSKYSQNSRFTNEIDDRFDALVMKAIKFKIHAISYVPYENTAYDGNVSTRLPKMNNNSDIHYTTDMRSSIPAIHSSPIIYGSNKISNMAIKSSSYYKPRFDSYYLRNQVVEDNYNKETWYLYGDMANSKTYTKSQNTIMMYPDSHTVIFQPLIGMPRVGKSNLGKSFDNFDTIGVSNTFLNEFSFAFYKNSAQFELINPLNDIRGVSSSFSNTVDKNTKKSYDYHQFIDVDGRVKKYEYFNNRTYVIDINDIAEVDLVSPYDLLEGTNEFFNPFFNDNTSSFSNKIKTFSSHRYLNNGKYNKYIDSLKKWYDSKDVNDEYINTIEIKADEDIDFDTIDIHDGKFKLNDFAFNEDDQNIVTKLGYKYFIPITLDTRIVLSNAGELHMLSETDVIDVGNKIGIYPNTITMNIKKIFDVSNIKLRGDIHISYLLAQGDDNKLYIATLEYDFVHIKVSGYRAIDSAFKFDDTLHVLQIQNGVYYLSDMNNSYILNINSFGAYIKKIENLNVHIGNGRYLISDNTKGMNRFNGLNTKIFDMKTGDISSGNNILNGYDETSLINQQNKIIESKEETTIIPVDLESQDGKALSNTVHPNENVITWINMNNDDILDMETLNVISNSDEELKKYFVVDDSDLYGINKLTILSDNDDKREDIKFNNSLHNSSALSVFSYNTAIPSNKYPFDIIRNVSDTHKLKVLFPDSFVYKDPLAFISSKIGKGQKCVTRTETLMPNGMVCINAIPLGLYNNPYIINIVYDPVNEIVDEWHVIDIPIVELELLKLWISRSIDDSVVKGNEILFNKNKLKLDNKNTMNDEVSYRNVKKTLYDYFDDEILPNIDLQVHGIDMTLHTGNFGSGYISKGKMTINRFEYDTVIFSKFGEVEYSDKLKDVGVNTIVIIKKKDEVPKLITLISSPSDGDIFASYLTVDNEFMKDDLANVTTGELNYSLRRFNETTVTDYIKDNIDDFTDINELEEINIIKQFTTTKCNGYQYFKYIYLHMNEFIKNHNGDMFDLHSTSAVCKPMTIRFNNDQYEYFIYTKAYNRCFSALNKMNNEYDLLTIILREDKSSKELSLCMNPVKSIGSATGYLDEYNSVYLSTNGIQVDSTKDIESQLISIQKSYQKALKHLLIDGVDKEDFVLVNTNLTNIDLDQIRISDLIYFDWRNRLSEPFYYQSRNNSTVFDNTINDLYTTDTAVKVLDSIYSKPLNVLSGGSLYDLYGKNVYGFNMVKSFPERIDVKDLLLGNTPAYNIDLFSYVDSIEPKLNKFVNTAPMEINGLSNAFKYSDKLLNTMFKDIGAFKTDEVIKQQGLRFRKDIKDDTTYDYSMVLSYMLNLSLNFDENLQDSMECEPINNYMGIVGILFRKHKATNIIEYSIIREDQDVNKMNHKIYTNSDITIATDVISMTSDEYGERLEHFATQLSNSLKADAVIKESYTFSQFNTDYKFVNITKPKKIAEWTNPLSIVDNTLIMDTLSPNPDIFNAMRFADTDYKDHNLNVNVDCMTVGLPSINSMRPKDITGELSIEEVKDRIDELYDNYITDIDEELTLKNYDGIQDDDGDIYYSVTMRNKLDRVWRIKGDDKTKAKSWTCAKTVCSGAVKTNVNYNTSAGVIWLDKTALGGNYSIPVYVPIDTTTDVNKMHRISGIVLDDKLRPYKVLFVVKDDKKILENWADPDDTSVVSERLIPMYTDTDGEYYFFVGGKKYKGSTHGAEVCGIVSYHSMLGSQSGLNVDNHVYKETKAIEADHKPIKPITGDTNIKYLKTWVKDNKYYIFDVLFKQDTDKLKFFANQFETPDDYGWYDKTKVVSWECKQKFNTGAVSTNVNYDGGQYIAIDKATYGEAYEILVAADGASDDYKNGARIYIDEQFRPYKEFHLSRDPKSILEIGYAMDSIFGYGLFALVPMYTDTDGKFYFFIGGKKYKGPEYGAELCGKVTYIKDGRADVTKTVYEETKANKADHKPIAYVPGDDTPLGYGLSNLYKTRVPHEDLKRNSIDLDWKDTIEIDWGYHDNINDIENEMAAELQLRNLVFDPTKIDLAFIYKDTTGISYVDLPTFVETIDVESIGKDRFYNIGYDADKDIYAQWDVIKADIDSYIKTILPYKVSGEVTKYEKGDYKYVIYVNTFFVYDIDGSATTDDKKVMQCVYLTSQNKLTLEIETRLEVLNNYYIDKVGNIKAL